MRWAGDMQRQEENEVDGFGSGTNPARRWKRELTREPSLQHDAHVGKQWDGPQGGAASLLKASNRPLSFSGKSGAQGFLCADGVPLRRSR